MVVKESLRIIVGKNVRYLFLFALMESYIKCMASHVNNDPLYVTNKSMFLIFDKLEVVHFKVQKPRSHDVMPSVVLKNEIGTFLCNFLFGLRAVNGDQVDRKWNNYINSIYQYYQQHAIEYRRKSEYIGEYLSKHPSNPMILSDGGRLMHEIDFYDAAIKFYERSLSIDGLGSSNMANVYVEYGRWDKAVRLYQISILMRLPTLGYTMCLGWDVVNDFGNFKAVGRIETVGSGTKIVHSTDVFIAGRNGYILSKQYCQLYLGNQRYMSRFRYNKRHMLKKDIKLYEIGCDTTMSFLQGWSNNYYHFLIEIAPKLFILEDLVRNRYSFRKVCILMPLFKKKYIYNEILAKSGLKSNPNIEILVYPYHQRRGEVMYEISHLISISWLKRRNIKKNSFWLNKKNCKFECIEELTYPSSLFVPSAYALSRIRHGLLQDHRFNNADRYILYASRDDSKRNVVIGETLFTNAMTSRYKNSFEIFKGNSLTLLQQINWFHYAIIVLGAHGAAFSNVIFCQKDALIIEFPLSPIGEGIYFESISQLIGVKYVALRMVSMRYLDDLIMYPNAVSLVIRLVDRWIRI
jgi:tetratricopeptide (TPR) repeat protein